MKSQTIRYYLNIVAVLYGISAIYHSQFKITGAFFNPALYAGFLVASLPWVLLFVVNKAK